MEFFHLLSVPYADRATGIHFDATTIGKNRGSALYREVIFLVSCDVAGLSVVTQHEID
jgi:hypothetical protein